MTSSIVPLGTCADINQAFPTAPLSRFRLEFNHDVRAKEMRWVLFTAAKRGAIGKLIFTIGPPSLDGTDSLHAHIKSVYVASEYRGYGLARVLYLACLSTFAELHVTHLDLEAEEDTKRHGKLVNMYQQWGFHPIPNAKILFIYNQNDCFRKVPMSLSIRARHVFVPARPQKHTWFCMIRLRSIDGTCLIASENGAIQAKASTTKAEDGFWQTYLGSHGEIYLRSVFGKFLCVEDSGTILADRPWRSTWETFQVVPYPHSDTVALRDFHGNYLSLDQQTVRSSRVPVPWEGGEAIKALVSTQQDSPPLYATIMRKYQTKDFADRQALKYGGCTHATMSIAQALETLMVLTGDTESTEQSWVLHHLLATAEAARDDGHPDWFQLTVFLRGFGMLFLLWTDEENAVLRNISPSEWLVLVSTWITGQVIPSQIPYPELNTLNTDHRKEENKSSLSFDTITLPWTPDEYLYRVLRHNTTSLPSEALSAVRLWSLRLWYETNCYESLNDDETKEWLQKVAKYTSSSKEKMKAVVPEHLLPYYLGLAHKYLPMELEW